MIKQMVVPLGYKIDMYLDLQTSGEVSTRRLCSLMLDAKVSIFPVG